MPDYSLFPTTKGNQFSFNDFRTALDVGNNQPISFADLYPGGVYIPDNNNFFTFLLSVPDSGEVSINDFQSNNISLADFSIQTPDANNHVEDQTTRNLATITLVGSSGGPILPGQRIYYELEPSTGVADPDFTADDVTFMTGRIGNTLTGVAVNSSIGGYGIHLQVAFKSDFTTEGNIVLRLKIPGLDNSTPVGTNDWTPTVVSPLTDTSVGFNNLDFTDKTVLSTNSAFTEINGWTIQTQNLRLGNGTVGPSNQYHGSYGVWTGSGITFNKAGVNSTIAAPNDTSPFPTGTFGNSTGDKFGFTGTPTLAYEFKDPTDLVHNGSTQLGYSCIRLYSSGLSASGDVAHGPLVKGKDWLQLTTSDSVRFKWRAVGGGDAYDIFAWLQEWYDPNNPSSFQQQIILNETQNATSGDSGWQTVTTQVAHSGLYTFAFMSGTFDYSGGQALGANLYVTDIEII